MRALIVLAIILAKRAGRAYRGWLKDKIMAILGDFNP